MTLNIHNDMRNMVVIQVSLAIHLLIDAWLSSRKSRVALTKIAVENIRQGVARNAEPDACPYADPWYWAGFQVIGW
jgi:hypothetical protein